MKWFVLSLVLINGGIFLWFAFNEPPNVRSVEEGRLPRVAEIKLIQDQEAAPGAEPSDAVRSDSSRIEPDATPEISIESGPKNDKPGKGNELARGSVDKAGRECFGIGWFDDIAQARDHLQRLERARSGLDNTGVTERVTPLEDFHWVLIPPMDSREAAMARYRELVDRGVEAYVVPTGESENAISLGLFRSRKSAEDLLSRRQAENIDAVLANFPRNRISYALVFEGAPDRSLLTVDGGSAVGEGKLQLIEFSDCEGVATAEKNP
ncbi:hypothetical protein SAMN05216203_3597 [Marinobacter daqiaonensis]|uniref:Sporulation related domain-containing protein n=1 Tax=Marinobacter daqiaonensis TaxID=650891 RepID=A0A1I6K972_9GAMM|nr:hypothetical protein [Marinobacter daqiaonensis]SFR87578.1 hypothetical protein SAMN05216203_3597 [Marinobacter daqiaonensis]